MSRFDYILKKLNYDKYDYNMWEGGLYGLFLASRRKVRNFALGSFFDSFIMLSVIGNTAVLAMDGLVSQTDILQQLNFSFTIIFTVDMGLKLYGMGMKEYTDDKMNNFDGVIVVLSLAELIFLGGGNSAISAFRSVRIFRTFRVLRVTRMIRSLKIM
jgi:hypothetical protein